ncbi:pyridoxal phosphate-dependent aminotransferase [Actinacidiphila acidipaludis]|uniref:Aminotransferase class I/II-fold pyridoxal phosphate-dependent enzyme n=1 Tax=Actinacidiphila acidipaludis TaxID=2873382 RepID=A0ABS7QGM3_9ACTN|nr:pyridoxal phosphate-dependent aminotransferase [Streptomyces acidipaludis]MBY8882320.1 aminotransferase class I/II-fold pyridoxal phosphate-dependent enzyme [Streptomyces acidipaludis]
MGRDVVRTLTAWEVGALGHKYNLADGHAALPCAVDDVPPDLLPRLQATPQRDLEERFVRAFGAASGEHLNRDELVMVATASQALSLTCLFLAREGITSVGLIEPAFDSLADTVRERSLTPVPVPEDDEEILRAVRDHDAVLLVVPNNPTGWSPSPATLEQIPALAARSGCTVVIDRTFRFYQPHTDRDVTAVLGRTGFHWITIDDTGKTWSTDESKVALLRSSSPHTLAALREYAEVAMTRVPSFNLHVVAEAIRREGGPARACEAALKNGQELDNVLRPLGFTPRSADSGLALYRLPDDCPLTGAQLADELLADGVAILPGAQFFWNTPADGRSLIRIALVRPQNYFSRALEEMQHGLRRSMRR